MKQASGYVFGNWKWNQNRPSVWMCSVFNVQIYIYMYTIFNVHMDRTHVCFSCRFRYSMAKRFSVHEKKRENTNTLGLRIWFVQWRINSKFVCFNLPMNVCHWSKCPTKYQSWLTLIRTLHTENSFLFLLNLFTLFYLVFDSWSYYLSTHWHWLFQQNVFSTLKHRPNCSNNISQ